MVRRLWHNWYYLVEIKRKQIIYWIYLKNVTEVIGTSILRPKPFSDISFNFIMISKLLYVFPETLDLNLENYPIIYFVDTLHLEKTIKNNFMTSSFRFESRKTSWTFIKYFLKSIKSF